ncbi:hypothetical protein GQX74_004440 [Glossina fuscipes]|nr:hypothetical protein GQX74_004440 [Glossina fuscipes]
MRVVAIGKALSEIFLTHSANVSFVSNCISRYLELETGRHLIYVKLIRKFKDYVHLDQMMETSHIGSNSQQNEGIADEYNERHPIFMLHTYIAKAMYFEIFKIMLLGQQWQWIYADITLSQQT